MDGFMLTHARGRRFYASESSRMERFIWADPLGATIAIIPIK